MRYGTGRGVLTALGSAWPVLDDLVARPGGHRNAGAGGELQ